MRARARNAISAPSTAHALVRRKRTAALVPRSKQRLHVSGARRSRCPHKGSGLSPRIPPVRAKHKRQFEIPAALKKRVPQQSQSVRAGVLRWVLEEGERARKWGQQLMVHGAARRTVYLKCSRCCSSTLLSSAPPETHRPRTLVPQLRRTARRMSSERNPRAGAPSAPWSWPL